MISDFFIIIILSLVNGFIALVPFPTELTGNIELNASVATFVTVMKRAVVDIQFVRDVFFIMFAVFAVHFALFFVNVSYRVAKMIRG